MLLLLEPSRNHMLVIPCLIWEKLSINLSQQAAGDRRNGEWQSERMRERERDTEIKRESDLPIKNSQPLSSIVRQTGHCMRHLY